MHGRDGSWWPVGEQPRCYGRKNTRVMWTTQRGLVVLTTSTALVRLVRVALSRPGLIGFRRQVF